MKAEQRSALRSFRRVHEFLAVHPLADAPEKFGKQSHELEQVLTALSQEAVKQEAGHRVTKGETKRQQALRETLWSAHMLPISRIAREAFGVPGMDQKLKMPPKRADNEALVSAANAMAEVAERDPQVFVEHGLPQDFAQQLRTAAATLNDALGTRVESVRRRVSATASVSELIKRGRRAVRLLNAILAPRLAGDPDLLAAWKSVKRPNNQGGGSGVVGSSDATTPAVKAA
jgi:hypothetical protein